MVTNWKMNFENTKNLAAELGLAVPMSVDKLPVAPHGSCFWFRTDAIKALYRKEWSYEDFPEEPLPVDGTISHAVERIYPFLAQAAGYYSALVMADTYSAIEYDTLMEYAGNMLTNSICSMLEQNTSVDGVQPHPHMKQFFRTILPKSFFTKLMIWKRRIIGPHVEYDEKKETV